MRGGFFFYHQPQYYDRETIAYYNFTEPPENITLWEPSTSEQDHRFSGLFKVSMVAGVVGFIFFTILVLVYLLRWLKTLEIFQSARMREYRKVSTREDTKSDGAYGDGDEAGLYGVYYNSAEDRKKGKNRVPFNLRNLLPKFLSH